MVESGKTLLIIDDDRLFCDSIELYFKSFPFEVVGCHTGKEAMSWCENNHADVILLDQNLPDSRGSEICSDLLDKVDQAKIIFITAYPSFAHAVQALRNGAYDYLSKPVELEELRLSVERALRTCELEQLEQLQQLANIRESNENVLIGLQGGLACIRHLIKIAATNRAPVLVTGETGTGKNVVAKAIHYMMDNPSQTFVAANCAALPESLIESEFFGHEKGAFTGAITQKKGLFELADGGTLFLDEIGELPLHLQSKLLGVLDDGRFRRVGGQADRKVHVRIIAATNVDLEKAIAQKTFREDLYYRMSVMHIHLPPLRERIGDIEELCRYFLGKIAPEQKIELPDDELAALSVYSWPGNVRELKNVIERAIILRKENIIWPSRLLRPTRNGVDSPRGYMPLTQMNADKNDVKPLATVEKEHIVNTLDRLSHNHTHVAKALGIARSTLVRKLQQYGIKSGVSN